MATRNARSPGVVVSWRNLEPLRWPLRTGFPQPIGHAGGREGNVTRLRAPQRTHARLTLGLLVSKVPSASMTQSRIATRGSSSRDASRKKFLRYLLSSNMGEVVTVFLGVVFAGPIGLSGASSETVVLPLLATQTLWINLVTDSTRHLRWASTPRSTT